MNHTEKILQILNEHPEILSEWKYECPKGITGGLEFSISTGAWHPGWVREHQEAFINWILNTKKY